MELYRIYLTDIKDSKKTAKKAAAITGRSWLFHWLDFLLSVVRYGVGPKQYSEGGFYKLRSFDRKKTYTRQRRDKLCKVFNDKKYQHILQNKTEFNDYFKEYVTRNWIFCKTSTTGQIEEFLKCNNGVLIKPVDGTKGQGIHILNKEGRGNSEIANSLIGKDILLEELLVQHHQMCYANKAVNTLRITTVMDANGVVHVLKTSFRCGIGDSIVDNYSAGGVIYPVNNEYCRIEGPGGNGIYGQSVFVHPGSDVFMVGRDIPFLKEAIELVKMGKI